MKKNSFILIALTFLTYNLYSQVANMPPDIEVCDDTGLPMVDLTVNTPIIRGQQPVNFTVAYHESSSDANANVNPISNPSAYIVFSNFQTIFARLTDDTNTNNYDTTSFNVEVFTIPQVMTPSPIEVCDTNLDGFEVFDLTLTKNEILNSQSDISVSFYESLNDAETSSNPIIDSNPYSNNIPFVQTLYIRVSNLFNNDCYITSTVDLLAIDCTDSDSDGVLDSAEDLNQNGNLDDDDTDLDNIPNYLDDDDDGDNVPTNIEININQNFISQSHPFVDTDGDTIENYLDNDDDGDGLLTIDEDYNNNGDPADDDTDNSGIPDYLEDNVTLSIEQNNFEELVVYPNPANDIMFIKNLNSDAVLKIYDLYSKRLNSNIINETLNGFVLNVSSLKSGLYLLKIEYRKNIKTVKLMVK